MYSLLVLGLVPGTEIQINFQMWLAAMGGLVVLGVLARASWKRWRQGRRAIGSLAKAQAAMRQVVEPARHVFVEPVMELPRPLLPAV